MKTVDLREYIAGTYVRNKRFMSHPVFVYLLHVREMRSKRLHNTYDTGVVYVPHIVPIRSVCHVTKSELSV